MRKFFGLAAVLAALVFALVFAGCSNSAGNRTGVAPIIGGGTSQGAGTNPVVEPEILQTEHVKVEKVTGGLKFTITRPTEDCYNPSKGGGFSDLEIDGPTGMPQAKLDFSDDSKNEFECFYPFCERGKRYDFGINIEARERNKFHYFEKISVVASDGSGELDFSKNAPVLNLTYDNGSDKLNVIISNLNLPVGLDNPRTGIQYYATNQSDLKNGNVDWTTVVWIGAKEYDGLEYELSKVDPCAAGFKTEFDNTGKDTVFVNCYVRFDVSGASGITWRSPTFTKLLKIR